jgi:hypothetical protein
MVGDLELAAFPLLYVTVACSITVTPLRLVVVRIFSRVVTFQFMIAHSPTALRQAAVLFILSKLKVLSDHVHSHPVQL